MVKVHDYELLITRLIVQASLQKLMERIMPAGHLLSTPG